MKNGKKIPLVFLFLANACFGVPAADANEIEMRFSGKVTAGTCTVEASSKHIEVYLGRVSTSVFTALGAQSAAKAFSIKLTDCIAVNIASIKMQGTPDAHDPHFFAIQQNIADAASGVAIKVWEKNSGDIQIPNGDAISHALAANATGIELEYYAAYVQTANTVKHGIANSYADFTIEYS